MEFVFNHKRVKRFRIAILPGDGIGPEVVREGLKVLQAAMNGLSEVEFETQEYPVGAGEYLRSGDPMSEAVLQACHDADAVLLGAIGLPDVRWPDGREISPQLDLRERLQLYCGLRPIRLYHQADTPLKNAPKIDLVLVRENTEGLFSDRGSTASEETGEARDVMRITRAGSERLFRAAFRQAQLREKRITLVDKANVLPSMVYFRSVFDEVSGEFPEVATDKVYVDAAALYLVQRPGSFDVLVTENMFGDILSDLAAGLVGGMGMAPSGDIGDQRAVFQPSHGSAPDIAGRGIANPTAMILSVAMMLDWLGQEQTVQAAGRIRDSVERVLANPDNRTADLRGTLGTSELGDLIIANL